MTPLAAPTGIQGYLRSTDPSRQRGICRTAGECASYCLTAADIWTLNC